MLTSLFFVGLFIAIVLVGTGQVAFSSVLFFAGILFALFVIGTMAVFALGRLSPNLFAKTNINHASNFVLQRLEENLLISQSQKEMMHSIANNPTNLSYAITSLRLGAAKNHYAACVAVFVRLSLYYESQPKNGLTHLDWNRAAMEALRVAAEESGDTPTSLEIRETITEIKRQIEDGLYN